jgi:hypothetical protein
MYQTYCVVCGVPCLDTDSLLFALVFPHLFSCDVVRIFVISKNTIYQKHPSTTTTAAVRNALFQRRVADQTEQSEDTEAGDEDDETSRVQTNAGVDVVEVQH